MTAQVEEWEVLDALVTTLDGNVTGVKAYHGYTSKVMTPAVIPSLRWEVGRDMALTSRRIEMRLLFVVDWESIELSTIRLLSDVSSLTHANSVPTYLMNTANRTLGGVVDDVRITALEHPSQFRMADGRIMYGRNVEGIITP